jgi:regulator of replication initiation timing
MNKIMEAIKKLLPESDVKEVSSAINEMLESAKIGLEKEYNEKLEEAYTELSGEMKKAEKIAEKGYEEAYAIIADLRNRLDIQGDEYKAALEEGYEEAYQMLKSERSKNSSLEVELYEEYDKKLNEMKEYIVDKVDQFLQVKGQEIYEQARKDIVSDPRLAEHKVVLDKIVDLTSNYLSDDEVNNVSSAKVEEATKQIEELKGQLRIMEARNIRLSTENTKLNESFRHAKDLITEQKKAVESNRKSEVITEQNERVAKAQNVTGRGNKVVEQEVVIAENANTTNNPELDQILVLSGIKKVQ